MSRNGAPVYTVCTNEQLAEITKRKPKSLTECMQIEGIGQGKADKYVPAINAHVGYDGNRTANDGKRTANESLPEKSL